MTLRKNGEILVLGTCLTVTLMTGAEIVDDVTEQSCTVSQLLGVASWTLMRRFVARVNGPSN